MPEIHAERRRQLRGRVAAEFGAVAFVITDLANIRYLTGFSGSNAVLVLGTEPAGDLLATDGRYVDQAAIESGDLPVLIDRATLAAVLDTVAPGPVVIEAGTAVGAVAVIRSRCGEPLIAGPIIEELRSVKDTAELASLELACRATSQAFEALAQEIVIGVTELDLARRLEQLFCECGGEDRAFPSIVATGVNSAVPHHRAGRHRLAEGDLLVIDAGARADGYHADMTRTWVVGREPQEWQAEIHRHVLAAQTAAVAEVAEGRSARDLDSAARGVLREAGLEDRFTHGLGHGVGLEIHEAPSIGPRATGSIMGNMAFTVEPGIYLPGRGGVRIEDTLVVTDAGPRVLTEGSRGLRVVGV